MTRRINQRPSAWMDSTIPRPLLSNAIANHPRGDTVDVQKVLDVLARQMEIWRFNLQRRSMEPQPAEWMGLISGITIPQDAEEIDAIRADYEIQALPPRVLGVFSYELHRRTGMSKSTLFGRVRNGEFELLDVVRGTLADMADALEHVRGKTGPQKDVGPAFRAVHCALLAGSDLKDSAARELAAELLNLCGIPAPRSRSRQAELVAG